MSDDPEPAILNLSVSPLTTQGGRIEVTVTGSNVAQTVVTLEVPDTVVISQPHTNVVGTGTFQRTISWVVVHVQEGSSSWVKFTATAGQLRQWAQCKIVG